METERDFAIKKRLNKIAVLIDRHTSRIEIQSYYMDVLLAKPDTENPAYQASLDEAMRLKLYHSKELAKLEEEQKNLLPA